MSEAALRELGEEAQAVLEAGVVGAQPQILVPLQADLVERALNEGGHASPPSPPIQVGGKSTKVMHSRKSDSKILAHWHRANWDPPRK